MQLIEKTIDDRDNLPRIYPPSDFSYRDIPIRSILQKAALLAFMGVV